MHESETREQFPKMIYRGGKPTDNPANFRIVKNEDELADLKAEGFEPYDPATKHQTAGQRAAERDNAERAEYERDLRLRTRARLEERDELDRAQAAIDEADRIKRLQGTTVNAPQGAGDPVSGGNSNIGGGLNGQVIGDPKSNLDESDNPQTIPGTAPRDATGTEDGVARAQGGKPAKAAGKVKASGDTEGK